MKRTNSKEAHEIIMNEHIKKLYPKQKELVKLIKAEIKKGKSFKKAIDYLVNNWNFLQSTESILEFVQLLRKNGIEVGENNLVGTQKIWDWYSNLIQNTLKKHFKENKKVSTKQNDLYPNTFEKQIFNLIDIEKINSQISDGKGSTIKGMCFKAVKKAIDDSALKVANSSGIKYNDSIIEFAKSTYVDNEDSSSRQRYRINILLNNKKLTVHDFDFKIKLKVVENSKNSWSSNSYLVKAIEPVTNTNLEEVVNKFFKDFSKQIIQKRDYVTQQKQALIKELEEALEEVKNENYSKLSDKKHTINSSIKYLEKYNELYKEAIEKMKAIRESN
jgi:hypothetical protein